jgi:hypothetical protein
MRCPTEFFIGVGIGILLMSLFVIVSEWGAQGVC